MRIALMLLAVLVVGGGMFGVLTWFFRRLRVIEDESWGPRTPESLRHKLRETFTQGRRLLKSVEPGS